MRRPCTSAIALHPMSLGHICLSSFALGGYKENQTDQWEMKQMNKKAKQ